ncbi:aspartic peptidase A1 [Melampsora larici-populina 98AG31]|uniref:Aspartic peptidase A1 n=1 Tax=Melampsora larici-populina (strain 98AG31 / pathotype 3-4-7) TaxID=747676 RepID=F4REI2_MELLP|nr:aspartic peptidase A1 [Melampsora larici-populina 98AG31]EGG09096.1 aspartic peptidase A1 [Melampsora larici-populina 98AG31]
MLYIKIGCQVCFAAVVLVGHAIGARSKLSIPLTNTIDLYTMPMGVGEPPQFRDLALDTGSFVAWCGAVKPYVVTKSTVDLHINMRINYGVGFVRGSYVNDTITFESENGNERIEIPQVTIAKAATSVGIDGYDGVIGLNPAPKDDPSVVENRTLMTYMWNSGFLEKNMFSLSFKPTRSMTPEKNGVITFGGIEPSLFIGQLYWYNCQTNGHWWDWTVTISYGKTALSPGPIQGIFDTGFTLAPTLSDDLFSKYVASIPGAIWDHDDFVKNNPEWDVNPHLLKIPKTSISQMNDLCFTASDQRPWCLNPEAQLIPEGVLPDDSYRYSYITPVCEIYHVRRSKTCGLILTVNLVGMKGHERYYVVYDSENYRIGLAETAWTNMKF